MKDLPRLICCPREVQDVEFELVRNCGGGGTFHFTIVVSQFAGSMRGNIARPMLKSVQ
jgi:hypothetical protein